MNFEITYDEDCIYNLNRYLEWTLKDETQIYYVLNLLIGYTELLIDHAKIKFPDSTEYMEDLKKIDKLIFKIAQKYKTKEQTKDKDKDNQMNIYDLEGIE